jgi:hypothetical protein
LLIHHLASHIIGDENEQEDRAVSNRMILRSLAEDGEFARLLLEPFVTHYLPKVEECLRAAVAGGDADDGPVLPAVGGWFTYNVAVMASFQSAPLRPVANFGVSRDQLVSQVVWFALRGLGLREQTIRRHYQPEALAVLAG